MNKKSGFSRVKLQSVALCPNNLPFLSKSGDCALKITLGGKENTYTFDHCCLADDASALDSLSRRLEAIVGMVLMGYDSTLLLYCSSQQGSGESGVEKRVMFNVVESLFAGLQGMRFQPDSSAHSSVRVSFAEVLDTQVRDLGTDAPMSNLKVREGTQSCVIDGLVSQPCSSQESCREFFEEALLRRSHIAVAQDEGNPSRAQNEQSRSTAVILGEVSSFIADVEVKQTTLLPNGSKLTRTSVLRMVSLAPSDVLMRGLEAKGSKIIASLNALISSRSSRRSSLQWLAANEQLSLTSILRGALKSLTTLVRVVHALASPAETSSHVPFRDSVLTRLLRGSLRGRCFLMLVAVPPSDPDLANRALRFASTIGQLYNTIWIDEELSGVTASNEREAEAGLQNGQDGREEGEGEEEEEEEELNAVGSMIIHGIEERSVMDRFRLMQAQMDVDLSSAAAELEKVESLRRRWMAELNVQAQTVELSEPVSPRAGASPSPLTLPSMGLIPSSPRLLMPLQGSPRALGEADEPVAFTQSLLASQSPVLPAAKLAAPKPRASASVLLPLLYQSSGPGSTMPSSSVRTAAASSVHSPGSSGQLSPVRPSSCIDSPVAVPSPLRSVPEKTHSTTPASTLASVRGSHSLTRSNEREKRERSRHSLGEPLTSLSRAASTQSERNSSRSSAGRSLQPLPPIPSSETPFPSLSALATDQSARGAEGRVEGNDGSAEHRSVEQLPTGCIPDPFARSPLPTPGSAAPDSLDPCAPVAASGTLETEKEGESEGGEESEESESRVASHGAPTVSSNAIASMVALVARQPADARQGAHLAEMDNIASPASLGEDLTDGERRSNYSIGTRSRANRAKHENVDEGQDGDEADDDGLTDLEREFLRNVSSNQVDLVSNCLRKRVNVHVKNTFERDAMQIAARNGCIAMLRLLFEHGGALFSRGPKGETLFHLAAYNGHVKTMAWLHERGILPEAVDMYGQTAVHTAARRGELHVLKYLHEDLGLDVCTAEDFDGRTPLECIPRRGQEELQFCREYLQSLLGVTMSSSGLQLRALPPSET